jgi:hypothetical protein
MILLTYAGGNIVHAKKRPEEKLNQDWRILAVRHFHRSLSFLLCSFTITNKVSSLLFSSLHHFDPIRWLLHLLELEPIMIISLSFFSSVIAVRLLSYGSQAIQSIKF